MIRMLALVPLLIPGCAQTSAPAAPLPEVQSFLMSRSVCEGTCPAYTVEISKDGSVKYTGEHFVDVIGSRSGTIDGASLNRLRKELADIRFFQLKSNYYSQEDGCDETPTDMPSVMFVAKSAEGSKEVGYYYGCHIKGLSDRLQRLSDVVDQVANTKQWIGAR